MGKVGCEECGKKLPVGPAGPQGNPGLFAISCVESSNPFSTTSGAYVVVKKFVFSNLAGNPFTKVKVNAWVTADSGNIRIKDMVSGNTIWESANITSLDDTNIETKNDLNIYPAANAIIAIEAKSNNAGVAAMKVSSVLFYGQ